MITVVNRRCHKLAPSVRRGRALQFPEIVNLGRVLSVIGILRQPSQSEVTREGKAFT